MKDIIHAFLKSGIGTAANMCIGLARNKYLAIHLGPNGMGLISMLHQFQATFHAVGTLGGDAPLVQGLASTSENEQHEFLASAFIALLTSWSVCCLVVAFGGQTIGSLLLGSSISEYKIILPYMFIPILAAAISSFLLAILTAVGEVGSFQKGQLAGNCAGLVAAIPLCISWQTEGIAFLIIFFAVTPMVTASLAYWYIRRIPRAATLFKKISLGHFRKALLARFISFGSTTIITNCAVMITWLLARREVLATLGPDSLGLFSATVTLSGMGLSLLSTALSSFYLPRFAAADRSSKPFVLRSVLSIVAPLATILVAVIQSVPNSIVNILFSAKFVPMIPLLRWWIVGDALRMIAYVFAIPVVAGAHLKFYLFCEIIFAAFLLIGIHVSLTHGGSLIHLGLVYLITYLCYLLAVVIFARKNKYL